MEPAPLHIVSGKGGVGKTTVSLVLAAQFALSGRRVLVCEVEGRHELARATGNRSQPGEVPLFAAGSGTVYGLAVEPEMALTEYLDRTMGLGMAGWALDRSGLGTFATSIAPGLRDVLLIGKVYEAARRSAKSLTNAYDVVILDAPPTGRIVDFLLAGEALMQVARGGPVQRQARSVTDLLRAPSTVVHLVTHLRELAVTETLETIDLLRARRLGVGDVYCNMVAPAVPAPPADLDLPLADDVRAQLLQGLAGAAERRSVQDAWRQQLAGSDTTLIDVPPVTGPLGTAGIITLAKELP